MKMLKPHLECGVVLGKAESNQMSVDENMKECKSMSFVVNVPSEMSVWLCEERRARHCAHAVQTDV